MISAEDEFLMRLALKEAKKAFRFGEVPVGCVAVQNGRIIARSHNKIESLKDSTQHAELRVIRRAARVLKRWRLNDVCLYSTLEPCLMCLGAVINCRIKKLVWGCPDERAGAFSFWFNKRDKTLQMKKIFITGGVLEGDCRSLMQQFFLRLRKKT
jgi:tRNA(adenine34) deaminase